MSARASSRPGTAEDFEAFFGHRPPVTAFTRVLELGGELVGIAAYWRTPFGVVVATDIKEGAAIPPLRIWKEAKAYMENLPSPASCVCYSEDAGRFLTRLGWRHTGHIGDAEVYEWLRS